MLVDELRGILAGAMRKLDDAAAHFDKALSFYREGGYRPQLARLCYDCADLLLRRAEAGPQEAAPADRDKAAAILDEALSIAGELGMRPLTDRITTRQDAASGNQAACPE